ncbi:hypothetical protein HYV73_03255 [Candidatus Uhrbacteria bacterium]|nr:hypothetical protein [Candidatus Uhrbacteria bacterium]
MQRKWWIFAGVSLFCATAAVASPFLVSHFQLRVTHVVPGTRTTVWRGQKDAALLVFDLENISRGDGAIDQLTVSILSGDDDDESFDGPDIPVARRFGDCHLVLPSAPRWWPLGRLGSPVDVRGRLRASGHTSFALPSTALSVRKAIQAEYRCNVADVPNESWDDDTFAVTVNPGGGDEAARTVLVVRDTTPPPIGTLTFLPSARTPQGSPLSPGSRGMFLGEIILSSALEPFSFDTLSFHNCLTGSGVQDVDGDCADAGEQWGDPAVTTRLRLEYQDRDGVTKRMFVTPAGNRAVFAGLTGYVPLNTEGVIRVYADIANIPIGPAYQGIQWRLTTASAHPMRVKAEYSKRELDGSSFATVSLPRFGLYEPHLMVSVNPNSPAVSGIGVVGSGSDILWLDMCAGEDPVRVDGLLFRLDSADGEGTGWNRCDQLWRSFQWHVRDLQSGVSFYVNGEHFVLDGTVANDACDPSEVVHILAFDFERSSTTPSIQLAPEQCRTLAFSYSGSISGLMDDFIRLTLLEEGEADTLLEDCVSSSGPSCPSFDMDGGGDSGVGHANDLSSVALFINGSRMNGSLVTGLPAIGPVVQF